MSKPATPETDAYLAQVSESHATWDSLDQWATACNLMTAHGRKMEAERDAARKVIDDLDEIFHAMGPRWSRTPSMCGRYPCWIVWLPDEGTTERKTLKEAILDFIEQAAVRF